MAPQQSLLHSKVNLRWRPSRGLSQLHADAGQLTAGGASCRDNDWEVHTPALQAVELYLEAGGAVQPFVATPSSVNGILPAKRMYSSAVCGASCRCGRRKG